MSWLDVGDGHTLFYEEVGEAHGTPVLYLHGGPGSGCTPGARFNFDPRRHRAVLLDQRSAGRSTPHASAPNVDWASISPTSSSSANTSTSIAGLCSACHGDRCSRPHMRSAIRTVFAHWCSAR